MKSLLILTLVLYSLQHVSSLKCYSCRNSAGSPCGEAFDKNAGEQLSVSIRDCDKKCMTAKYNFRGTQLYERLCTDIDFCQKLKDDRIDGVGICKECTSDLCNTHIF